MILINDGETKLLKRFLHQVKFMKNNFNAGVLRL